MKKLRILIIDDDRDFLESLAEIIELEGHTTVKAYSGQQAIEVFKKSNFDLILIDIRMPNMNGVETFRELRKLNPLISVAMMSAYSDQLHIYEAMNIGAISVLNKPINIHEKIKSIIKTISVEEIILVVEDDHHLADSLNSILEHEGFKVVVTYSGQQALNYIHNKNVQFLLLDIRMPGMNGLDLHQKFREYGINIPTIIITAYSDDYMDQLKELTVTSNIKILNKPLKPETLIQTIKAFVRV